MSQDSFNGFVEEMGGGVVPVSVEYDMSKANPVLRSYMENYDEATNVTDTVPVYIDSKIPLATPTQQKLQGLFAGRTPAEVGASLQAIYDQERN